MIIPHTIYRAEYNNSKYNVGVKHSKCLHKSHYAPRVLRRVSLRRTKNQRIGGHPCRKIKGGSTSRPRSLRMQRAISPFYGVSGNEWNRLRRKRSSRTRRQHTMRRGSRLHLSRRCEGFGYGYGDRRRLYYRTLPRDTHHTIGT